MNKITVIITLIVLTMSPVKAKNLEIGVAPLGVVNTPKEGGSSLSFMPIGIDYRNGFFNIGYSYYWSQRHSHRARVGISLRNRGYFDLKLELSGVYEKDQFHSVESGGYDDYWVEETDVFMDDIIITIGPDFTFNTEKFLSSSYLGIGMRRLDFYVRRFEHHQWGHGGEGQWESTDIETPVTKEIALELSQLFSLRISNFVGVFILIDGIFGPTEHPPEVTPRVFSAHIGPSFSF